MGQSTAETLREIEEAREKLEVDLTELGERLPDPSKIRRGFQIALVVFAALLVAKIVRHFTRD